ncbi:hypothetical protein pb186bvf_013095 [Paramecium bursaria]
MNNILSQYKCQIQGHEFKQVIGICENKNCKQPYRRVCFDCQQVHSKEDQSFQLSDIKDESKLEKMIQESKQINKQKIDQIDLKFRIQKYLLTLEMSEFLNRWRQKLLELNKISSQLNQFTKIFQTLSVEDYIVGNHEDQGIFGYLNKVDQQIQAVDNKQKQYLINVVNDPCSDAQNQDSINIQNMQQFEEKCLSETLSQLSKTQTYQFQRISKNISDEQSQQIVSRDDQSVKFWEYVLRLGLDLKTQCLHEQFLKLRNQTKLEKYQDLYLQAYSLHHSDAQITKIQEQLSLINQSIQIKNNYIRSQALKSIMSYLSEIIEDKMQIQNKNVNQNDFVSNQMANEYMDQGMGFLKNNNYLEAINLFDQAIKLNPRQLQAYFLKGYQNIKFNKESHYKSQRDMKKLKICLMQQLALSQMTFKHYNKKVINKQYLIAISLQYLQKYEEAFEVINYVIQQDPRNVQRFNNNNNQKDLYQKSQSVMKKPYNHTTRQCKLILLCPRHITIKVLSYHIVIGVLLDNMKRFDQAIEMFDQCIKIDPQLQNAYYNKGISLIQINRHTEALVMLDEAIRLNPQCIQAYKYKGKCLIQLGRPQEAEQTFQECYQNNPQAQIEEDEK